MSQLFRDAPWLPIAAGGLVLIGLIAVGPSLPAALAALRLLLGLLYILLVPGFALQAALFPARLANTAAVGSSLDGPERLALSFGLSVALVPPLALALDRLPWGLRTWPIVAAEALVIGVCAAVVGYRRRLLPSGEPTGTRLTVEVRGWWRGQDRTNRRLYGLLAAAVALAIVAVVLIVTTPRPADRFTEFYLLGPAGLAEDYPRNATAGRAVTVTLGISNREEVSAAYRAEVRANDRLVAEVNTMQLRPGETREVPVQFVPVDAGEGVPVDFLLYRDTSGTPYRSLRLWLKVTS